MSAVLAVMLGFLIDLLLADPMWMPHPVVYMGKLIARQEKLLLRLFPKTNRGEFWAEVVLAAVLPTVSFGLS